jgi:hypothetical protein
MDFCKSAAGFSPAAFYSRKRVGAGTEWIT